MLAFYDTRSYDGAWQLGGTYTEDRASGAVDVTVSLVGGGEVVAGVTLHGHREKVAALAAQLVAWALPNLPAPAP